MFLLYIPCHNLDDGTGSCKLIHFCYPWVRGPWVSMRTCLIVVFPLKCTCIPYLPHVCFILSAIPFVYGMTMCPTVALFTCLLVVGQLPWLLLLMFPLLLSLVLLLLVELLWLVSSQLLFKTFCFTLLGSRRDNCICPGLFLGD